MRKFLPPLFIVIVCINSNCYVTIKWNKNSVDFLTLILEIPIYCSDRSIPHEMYFPIIHLRSSEETTYVPQSTLGNLHHLLFIVLSALHVLLILIFLMAFYVRLFLKKTTKQTLEAFSFLLSFPRCQALFAVIDVCFFAL